MKAMTRVAAVCLLLAMTAGAGAAETEGVKYLGGTAKVLREGARGRLDTSPENSLVFESAGNKVEIPYAEIESFTFSEEVAHHLGVFPAIAVALVRKRQRKHFLRIVYRDEQSVSQVLVFEVPKRAPQALLAILQARAPRGCRIVRLPLRESPQ